MISIEETRNILKRDDLSDKEIENIRNSLYEMINTILDEQFENH